MRALMLHDGNLYLSLPSHSDCLSSLGKHRVLKGRILLGRAGSQSSDDRVGVGVGSDGIVELVGWSRPFSASFPGYCSSKWFKTSVDAQGIPTPTRAKLGVRRTELP
jgi:hypothetical protein